MLFSSALEYNKLQFALHCCASFEKDTLQLMRVPLVAFYALKYSIGRVKRCSSCGWTALSERRRKIGSSVDQCSCSPGTNKYSSGKSGMETNEMKKRNEKNEIETSNLSNPSNRHLLIKQINQRVGVKLIACNKSIENTHRALCAIYQYHYCRSDLIYAQVFASESVFIEKKCKCLFTHGQ